MSDHVGDWLALLSPEGVCTFLMRFLTVTPDRGLINSSGGWDGASDVNSE